MSGRSASPDQPGDSSVDPNATVPLSLEAQVVDFTCRVKATGDVDIQTAAEFEEYLLAQLRGGVDRLVLDASGIRFMDSAGLSALAKVRRYGTGVRLSVASPSPQMRKLLEITSMDSVLEIE